MSTESDLILADFEMGRFLRYQWRQAQALGYPNMAAFARDIALGTVALAPTPEDETLSRVALFYLTLDSRERELLDAKYIFKLTRREIARTFGIKESRFQVQISRILSRLVGWLKACSVVVTVAAAFAVNQNRC